MLNERLQYGNFLPSQPLFMMRQSKPLRITNILNSCIKAPEIKLKIPVMNYFNTKDIVT